MNHLLLASVAAITTLATPLGAVDKIKALLIDGQNNHKWRETTPVLKQILEETGKFSVDVATTPAQNVASSGFHPDFRAYRVVLSNYNGEPWPAAVQADFVEFVRSGGGFVVYHAADNSFPQWAEYNQMIAVGGWGKQVGPYARFRDGRVVLEDKPGPAGHHGKRHAFAITVRDPQHPIVKGMPPVWMHAIDELYDSLRGPAKDLTVMATAFSEPSTGGGTGENEPMLMTISFGKGRIFHTTLGHDLEAMRCVGFIVTLQRGAEWAATGRVKQKLPKDFPTEKEVSIR
jgi:type 1 glutamine amidotransferase